MNLKHDNLLNTTKKLIEFKSISPNQAGSIDYLESRLKKIGFITTRVDRGQTSNLIARFGDKTPIFAFAGHVDIVPPGNLDKWQYDPFTLSEKDEMLYGRGICDMKGAIASFLHACEDYIDTHKTIDGSIMLLITSDEESSGVDGTTVMVDYLKRQGLQIDYCLVGEPTSVNILGDVIKVGRRGSLTGTLEIIGRQGHIAYPDLCENPMHKFAPALAEITTLELDRGNESFPASSLQFANINSGLGVTNVIPGSLFANFNIRYNNLQTSESLQTMITKILEKHNLNFEIKWHNSADPFFTTPGKLNTTVKNAIKEVSHLDVTAKTDGGTSDGRFLVEICGELLELGLMNKSIHQINESIPKQDIFNLNTIYYKILDNIFL